jgi:hypothetical protein
MSKNRFAGLKDVKTLQNSTSAQKLERGTKADQIIPASPELVTESRRRGRPNGKRSNENFQQVTAYVSRDVYKQTKMKLLSNDNQQEFSELVNSLLIKWLAEK